MFGRGYFPGRLVRPWLTSGQVQVAHHLILRLNLKTPDWSASSDVMMSLREDEPSRSPMIIPA